MSDNVVGTVGATVNTDGIVGGTVAIAGGGGTSNYNDLINKPSINGVTLSGNKTLSDLGAASAADVTAKYTKPSGGIPASDLASAVQTSLSKADTALQTAPVASVAGKTGDVTLDGGDVSFSYGSTYSSGTVGYNLKDIGNNLVSLTQDFDQLSGDSIPFHMDGFLPSEESISDVIGDLSDLDTTAKSNLVAAINEAAQSGGGGVGAVDDVKVNGNTVVINGVANVPLADTINPGVVRIPSGTNASIDIHNGTISVRTTTPDAIKYGTNDLPIGANVAKETAFYGLASAAGDTSQKQSVNPVGTYTNGAKQAIKTMLGINDTTSYNTLTNKPSINGVTLSGNKTLSDLGAASAADVTAKYTKPSGGIPASDLASAVQISLGKADTALQTAPVTSVAGKTGAVMLDAGDVEYDDTDTYAAGSVGAGLAGLKSQIGDLSDLDTTAKNNLVAAINEAAQSGGGSVDLYYVTPEQYGAVGDGVTDDSQAVQDACDAGYAVYFASGKTYYLASTVTIDHDCHLFGGEGATIKTKTPTGGVAPNGIVVTGTLKKTTTLTSDYASTGTGDNGGNQWTLTDMTGIEIGDILIVTATDQYYSYSRQYYYLGATLLVSDIYSGHIYTSNSMPWDIENTENVTAKIYSAPTAIIEGLNFISDLDSRGNYIYLLTLQQCRNSIIRDCDFAQMDNGILLENCVNTLVNGISIAKSKYDNNLTSDGYGLYIGSCSNTIVQRVLSICSQGCIDLSGTLPNINTVIRDCNLASECRAIGIDMHENSYNLVVEDCTLAGLSLYGTANINRCRFIKTNRSSTGADGAITPHGSHDPRWARFRITNCEIDGNLTVNPVPPAPQSGIQAFDNIFGNLEIENCTGGHFIWQPSTSSSILSNTIQRLIIHNWQDCYNLLLNGSAIEYAEVINSTFTNAKWLNTNNNFGFTNIRTLVARNNYPQMDKLYSDINKYGMQYYLPYGVPISFESDDTSAHYQVCGKNVMSNETADYGVGAISGTAGGSMTRTANSNFSSSLSVNTDGELVFTQPNNTTSVSIYPICLTYVNQTCDFIMSVKLKNTGATSGATFRPNIIIINAKTGLIRYRGNGTAQEASSSGVVATHVREVYVDELVMAFLYCNTPVANSQTTLSEFVAELIPKEAGETVTYEPYVGSSRTGDGTLYSVSGQNNIMATATQAFDAQLVADYLENPMGANPSAVGVSF